MAVVAFNLDCFACVFAGLLDAPSFGLSYATCLGVTLSGVFRLYRKWNFSPHKLRRYETRTNASI
jgi:hypothetical protein